MIDQSMMLRESHSLVVPTSIVCKSFDIPYVQHILLPLPERAPLLIMQQSRRMDNAPMHELNICMLAANHGDYLATAELVLLSLYC